LLLTEPEKPFSSRIASCAASPEPAFPVRTVTIAAKIARAFWP
jgi:hypothetical protein